MSKSELGRRSARLKGMEELPGGSGSAATPTVSLSQATITLLDARIREELARQLAPEGPGGSEEIPKPGIDIEVLRSQVRKLIEIKLGRVKTRAPHTGPRGHVIDIDNTLLVDAVREVVARKLGLSSKGAAQSKSMPSAAELDKATLEAQIRRLLSEKSRGPKGGHRRRGGARKARPADRRILETQMREAVAKFLRELPSISSSNLDDDDIDRLIERAL